MNWKLLLDEDVYPRLNQSLQQRGINATHIQEMGRKGLSDLAQLEYAVKQQCCLVTFNVRDFVKLHRQYMERNNNYYGIIVSRQMPLSQCLKRLLILLENVSPNEIKNQLFFL